MAYDRFLIAPLNSGLQSDLRPWMIEDDAFEQLENAYVFRGRVRKRFGSALTGTGATNAMTAPLFSRLRIALTGGAGVGITNGAGVAAGTVPGVIWKVGQSFSVGGVIFTVVTAGAAQPMLRTDGSAEVATYDTTNGAYAITIAALPATQVYFYPAEPVMGLTLYEQGAIIEHDAYAFDTQFAYKYVGGAWPRIGTAVWHGSNSQFFWATNWLGANTSQVQMFVTNYNAVKAGAPGANDDPIYSFDGATWTAFYPKFITAGTGNYVNSCRIILPFKDRLLLLNTIEVDSTEAANAHFPARCRYSHNGVPFPTFPVLLPGGAGVGITSGAGAAAGIIPGGPGAERLGQMFAIGDEVCTVVSNAAGAQPMTTTGTSTTHTFNWTTGAYSFTGAQINTQIYFFEPGGTAWLEHNQPGWDGAGWIDAATDEEIISAEFIKDRLIVYFERSTWELAYTGNQVQPFVWQKINTELGSDATFSTVPFDKVVLGIGNVGIHACTGGNVQRIDTKIPDKVFDIRSDNAGIERLHGIRDYQAETVYWTFPTYGGSNFSKIFPNQILVYNYKNDSWALNDDCMTCFGYFEQQDDTTWATATFTWGGTAFTWRSGFTQADDRKIIAGNQQGYVSIVDHSTFRNAPVMQITNATYAAPLTTLTIENHTLQTGDYIYIENGLCNPGGGFPPAAWDLVGQILQVAVTGVNTVTVVADLIFPYIGGSTAARVSEIFIKSKQWNPYVDKGLNVSLSKIDFGVTKTQHGEVTIDYSPSSSNISMVTDSTATQSNIGTSILETYGYVTIPLEATQDRVWHPVYLQGEGECVQINIGMSDVQMRDVAVAESDFQLEGMVLYTKPTSNLR